MIPTSIEARLRQMADAIASIRKSGGGVYSSSDEIEELLREAADEQQRHLEFRLQIAGLVNGYHNDGTTLSAEETLQAIAACLGPALARSGASPSTKT